MICSCSFSCSSFPDALILHILVNLVASHKSLNLVHFCVESISLGSTVGRSPDTYQYSPKIHEVRTDTMTEEMNLSKL